MVNSYDEYKKEAGDYKQQAEIMCKMRNIMVAFKSLFLRNTLGFIARLLTFILIWSAFVWGISWFLFHYVWDMAAVGWWMAVQFFSPFMLLFWVMSDFFLLWKRKVPAKELWKNMAKILSVWIAISLMWVISNNYHDIIRNTPERIIHGR